MSNYPPGVSGNEWQIAGPRSEYDETRSVVLPHDGDEEVEVLGTVTVWDVYAADFDYECPECGEDHSVEFDPSDYYGD